MTRPTPWILPFALTLLTGHSLARTANTAPTTPPAATQVNPGSKASDSLIKRATAAFHAGDYHSATDLFEQALKVTPPGDPGARGNLLFTLGSCAFELQEFSLAETRFNQAGALAPLLSAESLGHAGFAALKQDALGRAREYLERSRSAPHQSPQAAAVQRTLSEWLSHGEKDSAEKRLIAKWRAADAAWTAKKNKLAHRLYSELLKEEGKLKKRERAYFHRQLAELARRKNDPTEEEAQLERAIELSPHPRDVYSLAHARLAQEKVEAADQGFSDAARDCGEDTKLCIAAREARESLRLLARPGLSGLLGLSAGYDSNAAQSGSAEAIGLASSNETDGSTFINVTGALAYTQRLHIDWALTASYGGSLGALLATSAQEQSLSRHQGTLQLAHSPTLRSLLSLDIGLGSNLVGLSSPTPFSWEGIFSLNGIYDFGPERLSPWRASALIDVRPTQGFGDYEYLDGLDSSLRIALTRITPTWDLGGWISVRHYDLGVLNYGVTGDQLFHCGETTSNMACDSLSRLSLTYNVPLGFLAPSVGLRLRTQLPFQVTGRVETSFEYRQYLDASFAEPDIGEPPAPPGAPDLETETRKERVDLRPRLGLTLSRPWDSSETFSTSLSYGWLLSRSNMERETTQTPLGPEPPRKNYDYDNRSFSQHTLELSFRAQF